MVTRNVSRLMTLFKKILARFFQPEFIFAVMALAAGTALVFVNGPFQAPDEPNHFFRAYQISEGRFFSERINNKAGDRLPASLPDAVYPFQNSPAHRSIKVERESLASALQAPLKEQEKMFVSFPNTAINFPLCYAPQAAGIYAARICGLSPLEMMYAGRLLSLWVWVLFMCAAIRLTPVFKWVMVLVGILPMHLYLAASLSADTMINGCAVLFVALVLRERFNPKSPLTPGKQGGIALLAAALCVMKLVYAPFVVLLFVIPASRFGSNRKRIVFIFVVLGLSFLAIMLWGLEIKRVYVPLNGSSMPEQLVYILSSPWNFLCVLVRTVQEQSAAYFYSFIGVLGWLDTWLPRWIYMTYFPVLVAVSVLAPAGEGQALRLWEKGAFLAAGLLSFFLIHVAQYLTWTKAGAAAVNGIQGRYFIPLVVPVMLIFLNRITPRVLQWFSGGIVTVYSAFVLYATCLAVFTRYYG